MAKKRLQFRDFQNATLKNEERLQVKGGYNKIPSSIGSTGYINWTEVDIRDEYGISINNGNPTSPIGSNATSPKWKKYN